MARVKRAVNAQKKRRTTLELASGYRGQRSRLYRKAKEQMLHSLNYAYRDRRARKGDFRQLWITRINAAARANGMTYNRFIQGLKAAGVEVDRKILAELAVSDAAAFAALVEVAKANVPAPSLRQDGTDRLITPARHHRTSNRPARSAPPRVVAARKLLRRAGRDRAGRFLVEGAQAVREALRHAAGARAVRHRRRRRPATPSCSAAAPGPGSPTGPRRALSDTVTPQGIFAVCDLLDVPLDRALDGAPAARRRVRRGGRSRQRGHRRPGRRRRGRRRRRARGRHRRPAQRQGGAGVHRLGVPPAASPASATRPSRSTPAARPG